MKSAVRKRSRDRREPLGGLVLTDRDCRLLRALARFRIGRTADLRRVAFPGVHRDTAGERLRKLFDAGFLEVDFGDRSEDNLYCLGPKGRVWLRAQGGEPNRVPAGDRTHHLAIVRLWAVLVEAVRNLPSTRIARALPDWELRQVVPELAPVPDLVVLVRRGEDGRAGDVRLVAEVDLGTEPVSIVRSKIKDYENARLGPEGLLGWSSFHLAVFAPVGPGRLGSIRSALHGHWTEGWSVWRDDAEIVNGIRTIVGLPEAPRTDSPYGSGTVIDPSGCGTAHSSTDDRGL